MAADEVSLEVLSSNGRFEPTFSMVASTERADENALNMGFARNALGHTINHVQLKALNSECNAHKPRHKTFRGRPSNQGAARVHEQRRE